MSHPASDELAAEALGLATAEEHVRVTRHLGDCESCLEEFARRCSERAAIEEAAGARSRGSRGKFSVAAAALFLGLVGLALFHQTPGPGSPGGSGTRSSRTLKLTLAEGAPEEVILRAEDGAAPQRDGVLRLKGPVELIRKNKPAVHASSAEADFKKKSLRLELAWPPSVERTGLQNRPFPHISARTGRQWKEDAKDRMDFKDVSIKLLFGSRPIPGDILLKEVAVEIKADLAVSEGTVDDHGTQQWTMTFSGNVQIHLPDGAILNCENAGWDSGASPLPTVHLRLE